MKLTAWIAKTGENSNFVAFMAHGFFAAFVVSQVSRFLPAAVAAASFLALAAIKEFWFDLRYERFPPQTVADSLLDFAGYAAGIAIGVLVSL